MSRADGGVIFSLVSLAVTFYVFVFLLDVRHRRRALGNKLEYS